MNLGHEVLLPQQRVQDVVHIDGQDVEEATAPGRVHRVTGVVWIWCKKELL